MIAKFKIVKDPVKNISCLARVYQIRRREVYSRKIWASHNNSHPDSRITRLNNFTKLWLAKIPLQCFLKAQQNSVFFTKGNFTPQ